MRGRSRSTRTSQGSLAIPSIAAVTNRHRRETVRNTFARIAPGTAVKTACLVPLRRFQMLLCSRRPRHARAGRGRSLSPRLRYWSDNGSQRIYDIVVAIFMLLGILLPLYGLIWTPTDADVGRSFLWALVPGHDCRRGTYRDPVTGRPTPLPDPCSPLVMWTNSAH